MEKSNQLREQYKMKRLSLSLDDVEKHSSKISENVKALLMDIGGRADSFLCYYPTNNEVNILGFYKKLLAEGKSLYFPRTEGMDIVFYKVNDIDNDFLPGRFNIMEPHRGLSIFEYSKEKTIICFTPGVVFDTNCNRMGYGKGFYDRFFNNKKSIIKIGLAYDNQLSDEIIVHEKDIPLDYIVTEQLIYMRK